jgi:CRISPR-associated RAMP protein (TIGR02581 family)
MFDRFLNRLEITGQLNTLTALRVSAGRSLDPTSSDLPVMKDALNRPLIPGASFKGALRSRLEAFVRAVNPALAKDPNELTSREINEQVKQLKEQYPENDQLLTQALLDLKCTDLVSQVFGAPWLAGKLQIRDLSVMSEFWFGQYQERDGVAIDRDTETASGGKKYDFQVVPAGTLFQFHAVVENAENWELGLLMLGLQQFVDAQVPLGGGRSRGLGAVELEITQMLWNDMRRPENLDEIDRERLLQYLEQLARNQVKPGRDVKDDEALKNQWVTEFVNKLRQN